MLGVAQHVQLLRVVGVDVGGDADHDGRRRRGSGDLKRRMLAHRGIPQSVPHGLVDDHCRRKAIRVGGGQPGALEQLHPVHPTERRVDDHRLDVGDPVNELDARRPVSGHRLVRDAVPLDGGSVRRLVDRHLLVGGLTRHHELVARGAPTRTLGDLDRRLPRDRAQPRDGNDREDGDADADKRERHPNAVHTKLIPCLDERPGDLREPAHEVAPSG